MLFLTDTFCVGRHAHSGRPLLRLMLSLLVLIALGAPLMAQEQGGGEASLNLPNLDSATFLGGIGGRSLLMGGLVVSALPPGIGGLPGRDHTAVQRGGHLGQLRGSGIWHARQHLRQLAGGLRRAPRQGLPLL